MTDTVRSPYLLRRHLRLALGLLILLLALSCATRSLMRIDVLSESAAEGQYLKTIQKIRKSQKLYGNLNEFLYFFDQGVLFHYAQMYDSSLVHLQKAEAVLDKLYARSVVNEAASILTNDNLRPYRSRRYERILLHELISMNYLAKDLLDEALVETRKVQLVVDAYRSKDRGRDKYNDDGMSHFLSALVYGAQREEDDAQISLYKSVNAYNSGPVPLPENVRNLAYYELQRAERDEDIKTLGLSPTAPVEKIAGLDPARSELIVLGLAGKCPILHETVVWGDYIVDGLLVLHYRNPATGEEVTLTLPAPPIPDVQKQKKSGKKGEKVKSGMTFFVKFAIPTPVRRPSKTDHFAVSVDNKQQGRTSILSDTERLLDQDMEDNRNRTIARTVVRVVLRTIAAQKTKQELQTSSPMANLLLNVGTDVLSGQLEKADARLCFLLPKTFQITRIPVEPGTHTVKVTAQAKGGAALSSKTWSACKVGPGQKRFLFFTCLQ